MTPSKSSELTQAPSVPRVGAGSSLTQQVLEAMVSSIRLGSFELGRLPPEDELAAQLGVSPGWVGHPSPKLSYFQRHATNGIVSQMLELPPCTREPTSTPTSRMR